MLITVSLFNFGDIYKFWDFLRHSNRARLLPGASLVDFCENTREISLTVYCQSKEALKDCLSKEGISNYTIV